MIGQEIDRQNSSGDYLEVSSLDQLTYINNECKVRLTKDIVMTKAVTVNNGNSLTIDLNGHTLTAAANSQAFRIQGGALTIEDSIGTGVIQGSGTVTGNGGAIWMSSSDSNNALTLTGGTIRGFTATDGGGVYVPLSIRDSGRSHRVTAWIWQADRRSRCRYGAMQDRPPWHRTLIDSGTDGTLSIPIKMTAS